MAPSARILWSADLDPGVVAVDAVQGQPGDDVFDIDRLAPFVTIALATAGREHLALSDGFRRIRLDVMSGSLLEGPVLLRYRLAGFSQLDRKIATLRRLVTLCRTGEFGRSSYPIDRRMDRWLLALRTFDALRAGASHREVAIALFGRALVTAEWGSRTDSLKSRVRRLMKLASHLADGGYNNLLR